MTRGPIPCTAPTAVLEQVVFALLPGVDEAAFLAASEEISRWSVGQPGFEYRCLIRAPHGRWLDLTFWSNRASADRAAARRRRDKGGSAFARMVDAADVQTAFLPVMARKAPAGLMLAA